MIQRIQAMLSHLKRSETSERHFYQEELMEIQSRMYKCTWWRFRSLRERGTDSIKNQDELAYWNQHIRDCLSTEKPGWPL